MSAWPASHRFDLTTAPEGLGLVHDFLNTVHAPDLLADTALARDWASAATRTWSELRGEHVDPPLLDDADLPKLRALRDTVARLVRGEAADEQALGGISAGFAMSGTGEIRLEPAGSGWRWLASALWGEILLSQQAGTWRRLKQCHNHPCESTFYDRSKNNSGVWCNVKTCGNVANLRASRARRRERERAAAESLSSAPEAAATAREPN
jgi:predicted RNA-binding Zn ribbon-like protein